MLWRQQHAWLATDDIPDMISVGLSDIIDFADAGVFYPLNDLIDDNMPNLKALLQLKENQNVWKTAVDGTLYAFTSFATILCQISGGSALVGPDGKLPPMILAMQPGLAM